MKKLNFREYRKHFVTLSMAVLPLISSAQEELNINEILELKHATLEEMGYDEETIQKKLDKFKYYWSPRLNENGGLGEITAAFPEEGGGERASGGVFCATDDADWQQVGPYTYSGPAAWDWQAQLSHDQWNGLMEEIYVPEDRSYYVASSARGGIWKREAGAPGWTNVTDPLNFPFFKVSAIVASPFDQDHLFASCGGGSTHGQGMLTSTDGGDTWSIMSGFETAFNAVYPASPGNEGYINVRKVIVDPHTSGGPTSITLYAITSKGNSNSDVWKSTDSGVSWFLFSSPSLPVHSYWAEIEVTENGDLLCASRAPYSSNAEFWYYDGSSWSDKTSLIAGGGTNPLRIRFTIPYGNKVYALRDNPGRDIYESTDHGQSWTLIKNIPVQSGWGGASPKKDIEYSPLVDKVFVGGVRLIEIDPNNLGAPISTSSIDQGHVDLRDIYFVEDGADLYIYTANDGGVSEVDYSGGTWTNLIGAHLPVLEFYDLGVANTSSERYLGGVTHNHAFNLNNGTWSKFGSGDGDAGIINYNNPDIGYVTYGGGITGYDFSLPGTYSLSGTGSPKAGSGQFNNHVYLHPADPDTLYYLKNTHWDGKNYLNVWSESANTWQNREIHTGIKTPGEAGFSRNSPNTVYLAEGGSSFDASNLDRLVKSTASGVTGTWTSIGAGDVYDITGTTVLYSLNQALAWKKITDIEVSPYNSNVLWISLSGFMNNDEEKRVLKSMDGGVTWREFSQGLPRYPVHSLVLVPATNGLMFAGTESGIFYRDNSMNEWECFNNGMPYSIITELDYNDCTAELIASTYGRAIWKSEIPTDIAPLTYTSNTTIPLGTYEFNTDVLIKAPAVFTILGTIEMAAGKRFTVEPGATLIIDGGAITNQCDLLWDGIYLGGDPSSPQLSDASIIDPNQATLFVINEGTIEHSRAGVTTQAYSHGFTHGARIFCEDANFIDNRFDVEMLQYTNPNVSYFRDTEFLTTGPLGDPNYVDIHGRDLGTSTHVRLWGVNDVEFRHNTFVNSGTFDLDLRGIGISSIDSEYEIDGSCSAYDTWNCVSPDLSFENLSIGISFTSTTNTHNLRVTENTFQNVVQGIYANGGDALFIDDNHFLEYGGSDVAGGIDFMESWGVYIEGTSGATVSDNYFLDNNIGTSTADFYSRGVIAKNTNMDDTWILRNVFDEGEMVGFQGWLDNSRLQLVCNEFHSEYGIYVGRETAGGPASYLPSQGSPTDLAGNQFFHSCADNESHIYFDGIDPLSVWETVLMYDTYNGTAVVPTCISNDFSALAYTDLSNLAPGYVWVTKYQDYEPGNCDPVEGGEGGGDTHAPLSDSEAAELQHEIAQIREMKSEDLASVLVQKGWVIEHENGTLIPGEKMTLLHEYLIAKQQEEISLHHQMKAFIAEDDQERVMDLLDEKLSKETYQLTYAYLSAQNGELREMVDEAQWVSEIQSSTVRFINIMSTLEQEGRSIQEMTAEEIQVLREIASYQTAVGTKALAVLSFIGLADHVPNVAEIKPEYASNEQLLGNTESMISVYPNPSSFDVTLEVNHNDEQFDIAIFDVNGKVCFTSTNNQGKIMLNVEDWSPGVYTIVVRFENKTETEKLIVK